MSQEVQGNNDISQNQERNNKTPEQLQKESDNYAQTYEMSRKQIRIEEKLDMTQDGFKEKVSVAMMSNKVKTWWKWMLLAWWLAAWVASYSPAQAKSIPVSNEWHQVWFVQNGDSFWINTKLNLGKNFSLYGQAQSDFDDTLWASLAWWIGGEKTWVVLWAGYSEKQDVWSQLWGSIGAFQKVWNHFYFDGNAGMKKFTPELNQYASSTEFQALLGIWVNLFDNVLNINGGCGVSEIRVDGYDKQKGTVCNGWITLALPHGVDISASYEDTSWDIENQKVMLRVSWNFWGGKSAPSRNFAKDNLAYRNLNYTSDFNTKMVQDKKEPTPEVQTPAPVLNALASTTINDNGGFADVPVHTLSGQNLESSTCSVSNDPTWWKIRMEKDGNTWKAIWRGDVSPTQTFSGVRIKCENAWWSSEQSFDLTVNNNL